MLKYLVYLEAGIKNNIWRSLGLFLKYYLLLHGCRVGKRLRCQQWPIFRAVPKENIYFGDGVTIGYRITFEVKDTGILELGDNVHLTQDILISCSNNVILEDFVGIAEFVSIRDSDHGLAKQVNPHLQESISDKIIIKSGSGVGRGSAIFRGVTIEEGVIIGANCVVLRGTKTVPYGIYLGNPIRLIGKRI
jgi:acetyltransferase-like isoleucine patch superfamily enzyme